MLSNDNNIDNELNSRLDEFFNEEEDVVSGSENKERKQAAHQPNQVISKDIKDSSATPLEEIKAIVLSLDWEITDEIMNSFLNEVGNLRGVYSDKPLFLMFLKILDSLGTYIKTRKVYAHPDAINIIHTVFSGFEKVVISPEISENEIKSILKSEVIRFRKMKTEIDSQRGETDDESKNTISESEYSQRDSKENLPSLAKDDMELIISVIKDTIRKEFKELRKELNMKS